MSSIQESDDEYDGAMEPEEFAAALMEKMVLMMRTIKMDRRTLAKYAAAPTEAATRRLMNRTKDTA